MTVVNTVLDFKEIKIIVLPFVNNSSVDKCQLFRQVIDCPDVISDLEKVKQKFKYQRKRQESDVQIDKCYCYC